MIHNRYYVAASMAIAIATLGLALWLATGRGGRPPLILSAIALDVAVLGMHYTTMAGLTTMLTAVLCITANLDRQCPLWVKADIRAQS